MNVYRGSAAFIMKLTEDERAKAYPMKLGYAAVGEVIEIGKEVTQLLAGVLHLRGTLWRYLSIWSLVKNTNDQRAVQLVFKY